MNFFEHQARARRRTRYLVVLYALGVVAMIVFIYLGLVLAWYLSIRNDLHNYDFQLWYPELGLTTASAVIIIITIGTFFKIWQLRSGGAAVAELLGGRPVLSNTTDAAERRVLNIVEEMALASGIQVPAVYLLDDEQSINAFAAGYNPNQAVIGVSRGSINQLTRDELQGVIAHEYSHILNGDMRLNIRLIGILHGILMLVLLGRFLVESGLRGGGSRKGKNSAGGGILIVGVVIMLVGGIGALSARLIKMAVSRQREYLADASAVQFTRSPWGIAGALKKIGASSNGSTLDSGHAEEVSHMCFANALSTWFSSLALFSTHPPLEQRIRAIEPGFDGNFSNLQKVARSEQLSKSPDKSSSGTILVPGLPPIGGADALGNMVGVLSAAALDTAAEQMARIPDKILKACHEPMDACAIVFRLLMNESTVPKAQLLSLVLPSLPNAIGQKLEQLVSDEFAIMHEQRLNVLELALATIRYLSKGQYLQIRSALKLLIDQDQQVTIFEYALYKIFTKTLDPHFGLTTTTKREQKDLQKIIKPATALIFCVANFGHADVDHATQAFDSACDLLGIHKSFREQTKHDLQEISIHTLDQALNELHNIAPKVQEKIFKACVACVKSDGAVSPDEYNLIRALAAMLECPLPPAI